MLSQFCPYFPSFPTSQQDLQDRRVILYNAFDLGCKNLQMSYVVH